MPLPFLLFRLHLTEITLQPVETLIPEGAIALEPIAGILEAAWSDAARAPLRLAAALDEPGALENLEVLGDGRPAHLEGLGKLADRGLAERKASEDRAPRRVGKGCESGAQAVGLQFV
jgi:hypothetical protein